MKLWRTKKTVHAHIILEDFIEMEIFIDKSRFNVLNLVLTLLTS